MYRANNEGGAETAAEEIHRFRLSIQRTHLVLAHSIQPDATKDPIKPNAAIIQTRGNYPDARQSSRRRSVKRT
jgi:hypothetical protein